MNEIKKLDIGADIGVGLGFTLVGIFILNIHYFFGTSPFLLQKISGIGFSILGIGAMFISLSRKEGFNFFNDVGVAIILFVPLFILFIFTNLLWLKIIFAILVGFSLIFVGMAIGRSLLKEDGSLRINLKSLPRLIIVLLSTLAALFSALATFAEKGRTILDFIRSIFKSF
jgi:hypothetical protein